MTSLPFVHLPNYLVAAGGSCRAKHASKAAAGLSSGTEDFAVQSTSSQPGCLTRGTQRLSEKKPGKGMLRHNPSLARRERGVSDSAAAASARGAL